MMSGNLLLDLSGPWRFAMGPAERAVFSEETVLLPGTMDENRRGVDNTVNFSPRYLNRDYVYTGPAVYQREVYVPADWAGRPVLLHLERTKKTRVWVDGRSAGERQNSYTTPHRYDLTALCRPGGAHTLTVEVDNSPAGMPHAMYSTLWEGEAWSHQLTEHGQTNWNGVVGALRLESPPTLSVSALRLRPDLSRHAVRAEVTLARLDEEKPPLRFVRFDISGVVAETAESFRDFAAAQGHPLELDIAPGLFCRGDEYAIRQLVSVLLDNAVKYADSGGSIRFRLEAAPKGAVLRVSNPCAGLDTTELDKLFDRFYRPDRSRSKQTGGFGVGLSIARSIVEAHHGSIRAECPEDGIIQFVVALRG